MVNIPGFELIGNVYAPIQANQAIWQRLVVYKSVISRSKFGRLGTFRPKRLNLTPKYSLTFSTPAGPNCCCSKGSMSYWSNLLFLVFDIRAPWRSGLSARVPECQNFKMVGQTSMTKCKALTGSAVKGLTVAIVHADVLSETPARHMYMYVF